MSDEVAVIEPPVRVPIEATVVLELPTMRLVILARVATRDEMKELVLVLLVERRLTKNPLVEVELLNTESLVYKVSTVSAVADALPRTV